MSAVSHVYRLNIHRVSVQFMTSVSDCRSPLKQLFPKLDLSSNTGNVVTILKTFSFCEAPLLTVRLPKKKALKEINTDASFEAFETGEQITLTRKCEWLCKTVFTS
uniref:Uncharacterized protein n=1 Tax=Ascaris lumbricoides TaxID=6252 RepID=A0A0M3HVH7_ASCLU